MLHKCHNSLKRIHRAKQALKFIQSCTEKKVYPKFVTISTSQLQKICLTKLEIRRSQALFVTSLICLIFIYMNLHFPKLIIYRYAKSIRSKHISDQIGHFLCSCDRIESARKNFLKFEDRIKPDLKKMGSDRIISEKKELIGLIGPA